MPASGLQTKPEHATEGRSWAGVLVPLSVAAACVIAVVLVARAVLFPGDYGESTPSYPPGSPSAYESPVVSVSHPPVETAVSPLDELLGHLPPEIAAECVEDTGFAELSSGMRTAVVCQHLGSGYVDKINYVLYDSDASMRAAFQYVLYGYNDGELPARSDCADGPAQGSITLDSGARFSFACYVSSDVGVRLWWSVDGTAVLARAYEEDMSVPELWAWFMATNTGPS